MSIGLSVATAAEGFTSVQALAGGIAFHAVSAVAGVQLVGVSKRMRNKRAAGAADAAAS